MRRFAPAGDVLDSGDELGAVRGAIAALRENSRTRAYALPTAIPSTRRERRPRLSPKTARHASYKGRACSPWSGLHVEVNADGIEVGRPTPAGAHFESAERLRAVYLGDARGRIVTAQVLDPAQRLGVGREGVASLRGNRKGARPFAVDVRRNITNDGAGHVILFCP